MSQPQIGFHDLIHFILWGEQGENRKQVKTSINKGRVNTLSKPVCSETTLPLTTLTSWDMETSNSTMTGSDTFTTGRMNWLYLLNNRRNNLSSPLDEKQPNETKKEKRRWENLIFIYQLQGRSEFKLEDCNRLCSVFFLLCSGNVLFQEDLTSTFLECILGY